MSREFIAALIARAVHEEAFCKLLQRDAETAADAMGMEYDTDDLRIVLGVQSQIEDLETEAAREYLRQLAQQPQNVFGSPLRPHE